MFKGIHIWGILAGFITDVVFSSAIGLVIGLLVSFFFAFKDSGNPALISHDNQIFLGLVSFRFVENFFGDIGSFLGGFVASWIGSKARMKNVFCVVILDFLFGLILVPFTYSPPLWLTLLGFISSSLSVYLGGLLAKKIL